MRPHEFTIRNRLRVAVEDRFVILKLREDKALLPDGGMLERLIAALGSFNRSYKILCHWSGLKNVTNDVRDFVDVLCSDYKATILAGPRDIPVIRETFLSNLPILQIKSGYFPLKYAEIDLDFFESGSVSSAWWEDAIPSHKVSEVPDSDIPPDEREWKLMCETDDSIFRTHEELLEAFAHTYSDLTLLPGGSVVARRRYLGKLFEKIGRNSLLTEFAIQAAGDEVAVVPYHSHALHSIEANDQLLLGRPGVIAAKTGALFGDELEQMESLLSDPRVKESSMQSYLERHPAIFNAIGYAHVYPQVVLQREDGTSLRPDFILEPVGQDWCDILDIKIPRMKTVIGKRDRKTLSAYIHELTAQLREYAAYFEDERLSKRVEELYGIKCYRPRLIGVIGRDPSLEDERQLRRLMTAYSDISVITFDQLLRIARSRLLI